MIWLLNLLVIDCLVNEGLIDFVIVFVVMLVLNCFLVLFGNLILIFVIYLIFFLKFIYLLKYCVGMIKKFLMLD